MGLKTLQLSRVIPESGRFPGEGHGNPLQYSCWRIPWTEKPGRLQSIGLQNQTRLTRLSTHAQGFALSSVLESPGGSVDKEPACSAGDLGSIPELGRSSGDGNGNPLQYSCWRIPKDKGVWWAIVHGLTESDTTERLSTHTQ